MKNFYVLLFFSLFSISLFGQSDVVTAGGTATGSGGSATYTVGQIAVQRATNGSNYIIEGVQQPYEIQVVGLNEYPGIALQAIVYPNPTQHFVQLRVSNYEIPSYGLTAQLFDGNGKFLEQYQVTDMETRMDLEKYPTATYQLRILNKDLLLKTFKVVKHAQ
ncbi:MAG: T9SS type A sorting domain-containing protein [Bacteroidales bacterium]|nr:T9SS type A sorting domain-containing protein [Bacteroidales bacterium]